VKAGDYLVCYLSGLSRWCGTLEVLQGPYTDIAPLFSDVDDKFVLRFRVRPIILCELHHAVPIHELWSLLKRTRNVDRCTQGWAWQANLVSSLAYVDPGDFEIISKRLQTQQFDQTPFPLSPAELRRFGTCFAEDPTR
jgi:hypothetical protein